MPQDRESGRRASKWGRDVGARIAEAIGAVKLRSGSNECLFRQRRVVIKCAHERTRYVGVLSDMLLRLDEIIGAFERTDGAFDMRVLTRDEYLRLMRPSRSRSHVPHRGQQVRRRDFEAHGAYMTTIRLSH